MFVALVLLVVLAPLPRSALASPSFVAFEEIALEQADAEQPAGAPTRQYYGFHFPPRLGRPSPYIVLLPGCRGLVASAKDTLFAYAQRLVREGYGALVIDIFRGTGVHADLRSGRQGTVTRQCGSECDSLRAQHRLRQWPLWRRRDRGRAVPQPAA